MLQPIELSWLKNQNISDIIKVTQFENALTNDVFLIKTDNNQQFVFKRLNEKARSIEDRKAEFLVQQLASKVELTPDVLAHSPHYKLQQYIEGELLSVNTAYLTQLLAVQFHRIHNLDAHHAPKQRLAFELQRLKNQLTVNIDETIFNNMLVLANLLDESSPCDVLCHGDLSLNNVLMGVDKQLYILDWEYAVIACRAYDLAFCICINEFTKAQSIELISEYFNQIREPKNHTLDSLQKECDLYLKLFSYINELWAICFVEKD